MALTLTSAKKFYSQLVVAQGKAGAFIDNLVDECEARFTAIEAAASAITTKANTERFPGQYDGDALAADVVGETTFGVARATGATTATSLDLVFSGAITAHDTDYATITIRRRTGAGAGTATTIASVTTKITGGLGNVTAHARIQPTATVLAVIAGDRFTYQIEKAAAGVLVPAMSVTVVETLT